MTKKVYGTCGVCGGNVVGLIDFPFESRPLDFRHGCEACGRRANPVSASFTGMAKYPVLNMDLEPLASTSVSWSGVEIST